MPVSSLSGTQTPQQTKFNETSNDPFRKVSLIGQQGEILPPDKDKKIGDGTHVPDEAPNTGNISALKGLCATLSPGAWLAILCVKEAANELEQGTKDILTRSEHIQQKLKEEASNIIKGAVAQLVCTVLSSAASIALSSVAGAKSMKLGELEGGALEAAKAVPSILNAISQGSSQIGLAVGGFVSSIYQAKNKEVESSIEQERTMEEAIRNHMQAQRELSSRCLDFYNTMQANINQTRARIMG